MGFGPPYEIVFLSVFIQARLCARFRIDTENTIFVFALKKLEEIRKGIIIRQPI